MGPAPGAEGGGEGGDAGAGGAAATPFACFLCRDRFRAPVVTTACGHAFCEACASGRYAGGEPSCAVCGKQTHGIFNGAAKLEARLRAAGRLVEATAEQQHDEGRRGAPVTAARGGGGGGGGGWAAEEEEGEEAAVEAREQQQQQPTAGDGSATTTTTTTAPLARAGVGAAAGLRDQ